VNVNLEHLRFMMDGTRHSPVLRRQDSPTGKLNLSRHLLAFAARDACPYGAHGDVRSRA